MINAAVMQLLAEEAVKKADLWKGVWQIPASAAGCLGTSPPLLTEG